MGHPSTRAWASAAFAALCLTAAPLHAEESATFDVSLAGIRIGVIAYAADERGGHYAVRGSARSSGIVGAFFDGNVDTSAKGRVNGPSYAPSSVSEVTTTGDEIVRREFSYANGIPSITRTPARSKPQKHAAPASEQAGTVDPTTAAYAILRERSESELCKLDISMFDGARRSRLQMSGTPTTGANVTCSGTYRRVAGFSPEEMKQRASWPVEIAYAKGPGDTYLVTSVKFPTSFGNAALMRR